MSGIGQKPSLDDSEKWSSDRLLYFGTCQKANSRNSTIPITAILIHRIRNVLSAGHWTAYGT